MAKESEKLLCIWEASLTSEEIRELELLETRAAALLKQEAPLLEAHSDSLKLSTLPKTLKHFPFDKILILAIAHQTEISRLLLTSLIVSLSTLINTMRS